MLSVIGKGSYGKVLLV